MAGDAGMMHTARRQRCNAQKQHPLASAEGLAGVAKRSLRAVVQM